MTKNENTNETPAPVRTAAVENFRNMDEQGAFAALTDLAGSPPDLTDPELLTPGRFATNRCSAAGWDYLFSTQRVDDPILGELQNLANQAEAVGQFEAMNGGAVMNRIAGFQSEERSVLHTACRDVFGESAPQGMGLRHTAIADSKGQLDALKKFLDDLDQEQITGPDGQPITDLVQIGIGGSDLGPRAIYLSLLPFEVQGRKVHFISNVDPDDAARVLSGLDLSGTLVAVVSKSGGTLETRTNEAFARSFFEKEGLDPTRHFIAVTGEGSPMDENRKNKPKDEPARYLRSLYMFDYIGGRYSVSSMVGGLALGFGIGYANFIEFLRGAHEMDRNALNGDIRENISLLSALLGIWNRNFLGNETLAVLPYSQALIRFVAHVQQLDMESNGKRINRSGEPLNYATGPIVWGEPGTNGQHAFYQLIHQSETIVPAEFVGFRHSQRGIDQPVDGTTSQQKLLSNLLAQTLALATGKTDENPNKTFPGNRPSSILMADRATPYSIGALLAFFENRTAFQGFLWNINSFDQEGVQLGKVLADQFLEHFQKASTDPGYSGSRTDPLGWALIEEAKVAG